MILMSCFVGVLLFQVIESSVNTNSTQEEHELSTCELKFVNMKDGMSTMNISTKLLHITVRFRNTTHLPKSLDSSFLYQPLKWTRPSGTYGSGILMLKPTYKILSLTSLCIETEEATIELAESSIGCIGSLNATEYEALVRRFLLNHSDKETDKICNMHIENHAGKAYFFHECCSINREGQLECDRIELNKWMKLIKICTYITIIFAILYCPLLIPSSYYSQELKTKAYEHKLKEPLTISIKKVRPQKRSPFCHRRRSSLNNRDEQESKAFLRKENEKIIPENENIIPISKFRSDMKQLKEVIGKMNYDVVQEFSLEKLDIQVQRSQILSENEAPTSLCTTFYEAFIECGIRKRNKRDCCNANIFGCLKLCGMEYPWYKCLRSVMRFFVFLVVCSPWIIRIVVYLFYERAIRESSLKAASNRGLGLSLQMNLTYYLTPFHALFIICSAIIGLDYVLFRIIRKRIQRLIERNIFNGLREIRAVVLMAEIDFCWRILMLPLTEFGIFGIIFAIIYWIPAVPIICVYLSFRIFPTVNLSMSFVLLFFRIVTMVLPINLFCIKQYIKKSYVYKLFTETNSFKQICQWYNDRQVKKREKCSNNEDANQDKGEIKLKDLILMLMLFISVISFVLLAVECIIFLTNVAVYTTIGLILNSSHAMQYISAVSLGWFYSYSCFGGISGLYRNYNKAIQNILRDQNKTEIEKVANLPPEKQNNTVFKANYVKDGADSEETSLHNSSGEESGSDPNDPLIIFDHGTPKWSTKACILLLNKYDTQLITKQFYFEACGIYPHGPGELYVNIMQASRRFFSIVLFLMFVTLVVLAFGDSYAISISNQLVATIAGGFVPWLLMKSGFLFQMPTAVDPEKLKENVNFCTSLNSLIKKDTELWHIYDLDLKWPTTKGATNNTNVTQQSTGVNRKNILTIAVPEKNSEDNNQNETVGQVDYSKDNNQNDTVVQVESIR